MSRGLLPALCLVAAGASHFLSPDDVMAQTTYGEYRSECIGGEIVVWGVSGDIHLSRGDTAGGEIKPSSEVIWFCGDNRQEFLCENSRRTNFVEVHWQESGEVTFLCQRR